ncbi:DUF2059 domain-containing protein [Croceibacterium ferulae]|uniref:DUF2059 domain-containing protein n=1 Tax=Croceibacterium ferulae TaxID=1854641 RepID=UPI000EB47604|nr:DUF2059 domain-containing protein [Croceibacterium ferulae]
MLRRLLFAVGAIALLPATPVAAQEAQATDEGIRGFAQALFPPDPLTPEQEARMPAASVLAQQIVVPGSYASLMAKLAGTTYRPMLGLLGLGKIDTLFVVNQLGLSVEQWQAVPEPSQAELARLFDSAYDQRTPVSMAVATDALEQVFAAMEPSMRQAVAEAHARRFTQSELEEMAAFFATPVGKAYAGQWLALSADPQIMSAGMEVTPRMIQAMPDIQQRMKLAQAALGERRSYADFSAAERNRAAQLVGLDRATLDQTVADATEKSPRN